MVCVPFTTNIGIFTGKPKFFVTKKIALVRLRKSTVHIQMLGNDVVVAHIANQIDGFATDVINVEETVHSSCLYAFSIFSFKHFCKSLANFRDDLIHGNESGKVILYRILLQGSTNVSFFPRWMRTCSRLAISRYFFILLLNSAELITTIIQVHYNVQF